MKDKLLLLIDSINLPLILFVCYAIKITAFSADFSSALVLAILSATYVYCRQLKLKEPNKPSEKIVSEINRLSGEMKEVKGALGKVNLRAVTTPTKKF